MKLPFHHSSQAGTTLVELLVSVGLTGIVLITTITVIKQIEDFRAFVTNQADKENLRSLVRGKISCDSPCSEMIKKIPSEQGKLKVSATCGIQGASDLRVMLLDERNPKSEEAPLFDIGDGYPCQPRQPKTCLYACHARGELVERGYLHPPLSPPVPAFAVQALKCPTGDAVGVDFGTGRIICANDRLFGPDGPLCKFPPTVGRSTKMTFILGGKVPCTEYSQKNGMNVSIGGKIVVQIADGFIPSANDQFAIVIGHSVQGRFSNAPTKVSTKMGTFHISYEPKKIILYGFEALERNLSK